DLRFILLDGIVSNGYRSWVADGRSQDGGWSDKAEVAQVRPAYANGPLQAWLQVSDPQRRAALQEQIARESAGDDERASKDSCTYLPGLALRLRFAATQRIFDAQRGRGMDGPALRAAFIAEYERMTIESSIFVHEGRHAIDDQSASNRFRSPAERE